MKVAPPAANSASPMEEYAHALTADLLDRLEHQVNLAWRDGGEEAIHDLRTTIRRFSQSLAIFGQFYPKKARRIRRKLKKQVMQAAGEIRNRDIALDLLAKAEVPEDDPLWDAIRAERARIHEDLATALKQWSEGDFSSRWRRRLALPPTP